MRPYIVTSVFVLVLASLGAPLAHAAAPSSDRTWTKIGYGQTENDAKQIALDDAVKSVQEYLDGRFPRLGWSPNAADLVRFGVVHLDAPTPRKFDNANLGNGFEAVAHVDLSDANLRKMQEEVDKARTDAQEPIVSERLGWVGRALAAFVALFLVIAGYLRLEELTRGYYTTLLRMGAGAVVLLTVLGLFLVR